jgi:hypothetical protein
MHRYLQIDPKSIASLRRRATHYLSLRTRRIINHTISPTTADAPSPTTQLRIIGCGRRFRSAGMSQVANSQRKAPIAAAGVRIVSLRNFVIALLIIALPFYGAQLPSLIRPHYTLPWYKQEPWL